MRLLNEKLLVLILLNIVSSQVNTDIKKLQEDYEKNERLYDYNKYTQEISNFGKFMLCTDVIQKMGKIRLMGEPYSYNGSLMQLPEFETIDMTVELSSRIKNVIHCPLSKIKYWKYPDVTFLDIYLIRNYKKFCVFMLEPYDESTPGMKIVAEICGVLVDIRYNKDELEAELKHKLESNDLDFLQWPELMDMSEEKKLITCFEFYEKNYYYIFHTEDNITIPIFKISNHFRLVDTNGIEWTRHTKTLTCPMNEIDFTTGYKSIFNCKHSAVPFHLARSINPGCVYKVALIETNNNNNITIINDDDDDDNNNNTHYHNNQTDEDYRFQVSIQAELCAYIDLTLEGSSINFFVSCGEGVLDQPRTNKYQIEAEFISAWNTIIQPNATIPSFEFLNLSPISQFRLCQNVHKKMYGTRMSQMYSPDEAPVRSSTLILNNSCYINVYAMHCPTLRRINPIILLESVNLGCVYSLTKRNNFAVFDITAEICDVYPLSHLLNFHRQLFNVQAYIVEL